MVSYALAVPNAQGGTTYYPLTLGTFGYPHLIVDGVEIANEPPESPPVGKLPVLAADGVTVVLVAFVVIDATGDGPLFVLESYLGTTINERWRKMQLNDQSRVGLSMRDANGPVDLTNAILLEVVCRRADRSTLTKAAQSAVAPNSGVNYPSMVVAQFDDGDVQSYGEWTLQAHVILANGREFYGEVLRVEVKSNV